MEVWQLEPDMSTEYAYTLFSTDVRRILEEAESRLLSSARGDPAARAAVKAAVGLGNVELLSVTAVDEVSTWETNTDDEEVSVPQSIANDIQLLRAGTVMSRTIVFAMRTLAMTTRWNGTVEGAERVAPGLFEPDMAFLE